jgi:integrase
MAADVPQGIRSAVACQLSPKALRHSYGSYHLAKHRNGALTAEQMGHKNARMLYAHYREVVKDSDDIASYWNLLPSSAGEIAIFAA